MEVGKSVGGGEGCSGGDGSAVGSVAYEKGMRVSQRGYCMCVSGMCRDTAMSTHGMDDRVDRHKHSAHIYLANQAHMRGARSYQLSAIGITVIHGPSGTNQTSSQLHENK